jgi:hypothetical protein
MAGGYTFDDLVIVDERTEHWSEKKSEEAESLGGDDASEAL